MATEDLSSLQLIGTFAGIGALIALGKLLGSKERLTWRLILGRSIVSAGLAIAAGSLVAFIPGLTQTALIGLSAALAIMGEQFLEKILHEKLHTQ